MSQVPRARGQPYQPCVQSPQADPTLLTQASCWSPTAHTVSFMTLACPPSPSALPVTNLPPLCQPSLSSGTSALLSNSHCQQAPLRSRPGRVSTLKSGTPTDQHSPRTTRQGREQAEKERGDCDPGRRCHTALTLPVKGRSPLGSGCPRDAGINRVCQKGCSGPQTGPIPAEQCQVTPVDGTQS